MRHIDVYFQTSKNLFGVGAQGKFVGIVGMRSADVRQWTAAHKKSLDSNGLVA